MAAAGELVPSDESSFEDRLQGLASNSLLSNHVNVGNHRPLLPLISGDEGSRRKRRSENQQHVSPTSLIYDTNASPVRKRTKAESGLIFMPHSSI